MFSSLQGTSVRWRAVGVVVLLALGLSSCALFARSRQAASAPPLPSIQQFGADARTRTTPDQQAALADNAITLAEYNAAVARVVACSEAAGVTISSLESRGQRPAAFSVDAATEEQLAKSVGAVHGCEEQHIREIQLLWSLQKAHYSEEDAQSALGALRGCLVRSGIEYSVNGIQDEASLAEFLLVTPEHTVDPIWRLARAAYGPCKRTIEEDSGFVLP